MAAGVGSPVDTVDSVVPIHFSCGLVEGQCPEIRDDCYKSIHYYSVLNFSSNRVSNSRIKLFKLNLHEKLSEI